MWACQTTVSVGIIGIFLPLRASVGGSGSDALHRVRLGYWDSAIVGQKAGSDGAGTSAFGNVLNDGLGYCVIFLFFSIKLAFVGTSKDGCQ